MPPADSTAAWPLPATPVSADRPRAHDRHQSLHRRAAVGHRDGRLAGELQRHAAPLVVGNLVISGTAGGDEGVRGFIAAYEADTGREAWRFWTVPKPGEPGSETWQGTLTEHRGGAAWMTGTYDPQLDLVYWPTGNPGLDFNGDERQGDNLYSDSVLALEAADRQAPLAFPVHAARHPRLGRPGDARAARCQLAGPAAQAADSGQPQRVLLRARSDERRAAPGRDSS